MKTEQQKTNELLLEIKGLLSTLIISNAAKSDELQSKITTLQKEVKLLKYGEGVSSSW